MLIDKNVMVPMRDGIRLATDVYRLGGPAPAPVLLTRTPYDKEHALVGSTGVTFDVLRAVQAGYAVVIQNVRGCILGVLPVDEDDLQTCFISWSVLIGAYQ